MFSNIAYQYFYFIYRDSVTLEEIVVPLKEQNYLLDEAAVTSYKLTTNKPRAIELSRPSEPRSADLRSDAAMLSTDLEAGGFLYELFSRKASQLAALRRLQVEDAYRQRLEMNNNREAVIKLTGLNREELEAFMFYCKYSVRMRHMNDYQFLLSVQRCFRNYVKERELEEFLNQWD